MTRWERFYEKQTQDPHMKRLIENELESLRLGAQLAKLRQQERLSQTQLAARAEMSAPKISVIENSPRDVKIGTLIRLAHALNRELYIHFRRRRARGPRARDRASGRSRPRGPDFKAHGSFSKKSHRP